MNYKEFAEKANNGEPVPLTLKTFAYALLYCFRVWQKTPRSDRPCPRP